MGPGFFNFYGRPNILITPKDVINFWPDEWDKVLGGHKAVGHYVQVYMEKEKIWREGKVVNYRAEDDKHTILLDPLVPPTDFNADSPATKAVEQKTEIRVKLSTSIHNWNDSNNRHRLNLNQLKATKRQLAMSESDIGCFVRVWWSKYQRSFYGRVIAYDGPTRQHSIIYEDGDIREYDMQTKAYEIIDISVDPDLVRSVESAGSVHAAAAKIVSKWYQSRRDAPDTMSESGKSVDTVASANTFGAMTAGTAMSAPSVSVVSTTSALPAEPQFVSRPLATQGFGLSYHHINVVNIYFSEGGSDSIFHLLSDPSRPPPTSKILLLDLQFVYQMRHMLTTSSFRDLVWEIKEGVSFALSRYDDAQFKDLTINELVDIFSMLRDLIALTTSADKGSLAEQQLDELRMTLALKLLRCSQIQKRYLGLSMIKDTIDAVAPKIAIFTSKRVQYLISTKNGRYARDPSPNTTKLAGAAPPTPAHQSFPQTTLSATEIANWIIQNQVVEEIFGSSIHQDLASKSDLILVFLAHRKVLTEAHTEIIWQSCRGAHEAVVKVVHQLIMLIVPVIEPNLRMKFFTQISSVPVKEYNEALLLLIKAYTVQALLKMKDEATQTDSTKTASTSVDIANTSPVAAKSSSESVASDSSGSVFSLSSRKGLVVSAPPRQWMGFGILWQFIQDPIVSSTENQKTSMVDDSLFDLAIQLLVELLQLEFMSEREKVMQRCLENIRVGISVPASLQLLRRTLATYATTVKSWFAVGRSTNSKVPTISSQIEKFQKQEKLLDVLFMDIDRYHKTMVEHMMKSPSAGNLADPTAINTALNAGRMSPRPATGSRPQTTKTNLLELNTVNDSRIMMNGKISRTSHLKGVIERLDFLKFILSRSSLSLNDSQVMMLWKAFGEGAVSVETFEKLIEWLDSLIARESKSYSVLLQSLAQDCDPLNPRLPSKLSFIWQDLSNVKGHPNFGASTLTSSYSSAEMNDGSSDEASVSAFEENVLVRLFEQHMSKWLAQRDKLEYISRVSVATLCMKLFLLVNLSNRALRVESDGVWFRMGPLSGLTVIWRLALDSSDFKISEAAITLIVELHHRTPPKFRGANQIRSYLMRLCFIQLSTAVQSLRLEDVNSSIPANATESVPVLSHAASEKNVSAEAKSSRRRSKTAGEEHVKDRNSRVVIDGEGYPVTFNIAPNSPQPLNRFPDTPAIAVAPGNDDWYDDGDSLVDSKVIATRITRLISLMRLFIQRFQKVPTQIYTIKVLAGREEAIAVTISMLSSETIGALRQKVAGHFKEQPNAITLVKSNRPVSSIGRSQVPPSAAASIGAIWSNSSAERLEKDDMTLKQAKFQAIDAVIAKKKESLTPAVGTANASTSAIQQESVIQPDFIQPNELVTNILDVMKPVSWLSVYNSFASSMSTSLLNQRHEHEPLYSEPFFPLSRRPESNLWSSESSSFAGNSFASETAASNEGADSMDYLGQYLKKSPHHIDQLLEMLDGYLSAEILKAVPFTISDSTSGNSDLSTIIWEVVQSLPVHTELLHQVKDLVNDSTGGSIRRLLDLSSPYRFLYTLQIVDSLLDAGKSMAIQTIASKVIDTNISYTPTSSSSSSSASISKQLAKVAFDWSVKFLFLSGAEHIIQLLNQILKLHSSKMKQQASTDLEIQVGEDSSQDVGNAADAVVLTATILMRILHRLLLLDPLYDRWHCYQKFNSSMLMDGIFGGNHQKVPPGIVLACVDASTTVHQILDYVLAASKLPQVNPLTIQSLSEHALTLVYGLCVSVEEGFMILSAYHAGFSQWIKTMALDCSYSNIRHGTCRRIFESSANICTLLNDINLVDSDREQRSSLLSYTMDSVLACVPYSKMNISVSYQAEQLYSLTSCLVSLHYLPSIIFPAEITTRRKVSSETATKLVSTPSSHDLGSLVSRTTHRPVPGSFDFKALYMSFIRILIDHKSSESFHSYEIDGALVGALRVLLILSTCDTKQENQHLRDMLNHDDELIKNIYTLVDHLYNKCLFPPENIPTNTASTSTAINMGASCQVWESRNLAYAVLHQLCYHNEENLNFFAQVMSRNYHVSKFEAASAAVSPSNVILSPTEKKLKQIHWGYNPNLLAKDSDAFVGLVNQGGTCYMNSFLQQLFHVPEFCDAILKVSNDSKVEDNDEQSSSSDSFLFQLQVLFGYLRLSQKKFYDTITFCESFKDYDGQPISLIEQKDINEFAGMLFDKLESNGECKKALGNTIQGKVVYKTKSLESAYRSEREENFYMITAEVKGKSSLQESLDLLVAEELFSGDNKIEDEEAGRKVDAIRRCSIRDLPSTLIIHLKRFEFDLETMDRKKVNDFITFPMDLDMFPYTEEGISTKEQRLQGNVPDTEAEILNAGGEDDNEGYDLDSDVDPNLPPSPSRQRAVSQTASRNHPANYYQYHLIGVVAHVGAIDRGHYYSFIKERQSQKWYEFNDRNVFPFSAEAIPNECFGGEETVNSANGQTTRMKQNNAYLLLYERIPLHRNKSKATAMNDEASSAIHVYEGKKLERIESIDRSVLSIDSHNEKANRSHWQLADMSKRVLEAVWSENIDFQTDRCIFSNYHFRFMWQLLSSPSFNSLLSSASNMPMVATLAADEKAVVEGVIHARADYVESNNNSLRPSIKLEDYEIHSRSHSPHPSPGYILKVSPTLPLLTLLGLKFTVEVVSSARALSCLPIFFDRLFEIIAVDSTGECAYAIINELGIAGNKPSIAQRYIDPHYLHEKRRHYHSGQQQTTTSTNKVNKKANQDLNFMAENLHPWLTLIFVHCPIPTTVRAFAKLIFTCIKKIQHREKDQYLDSSSSSAAAASAIRKQTSIDGSVTGTEDITGGDPNLSYTEILARCRSPVTVFMNKLLIIFERITAEDAVSHEGFQSLGGLLYHVAMLGYEERVMMLKLQSIFRMVCAILALSSSPIKLSAEHLSDCIRKSYGRLILSQLRSYRQHCSIDMISLLVRSTIIRRSDSREIVPKEIAIKSLTMEAQVSCCRWHCLLTSVLMINMVIIE
jgi:ubiquitin C-terminal hydrolase